MSGHWHDDEFVNGCTCDEEQLWMCPCGELTGDDWNHMRPDVDTTGSTLT